MQRRLTIRPAVFYIGALVVVLVAVGLFAVARGQERPARSPAPTTAPGTLSPYDEALQGINDDGTSSKDTALKVFAAAFGPLPDVPTPRPDSSYRSGSLAIRMVQAYWTELTDAQKSAINAYVGPTAAASMSKVVAPRPAAPAAVAAAFRPQPSARLDLTDLRDDYQKMLDADIADISTAFGRPLGIPVPVILGGSENGDAWTWATGNWDGAPAGGGAPTCTMTVPPTTYNDPTRQPFLRWVFAHEVWHCFEYRMIDYKTEQASPPWVIEGEANWVAEAVTGGAGAPPPAVEQWRQYIITPEMPLYGRSYDGMGFFGQLAKNGTDPWKVLEAVVKAGTNDGAFEAAGANAASFMDTWGSSYFRNGKPSTSWAMTDGYGIPPLPLASRTPIAIADGTEDSFDAKPVTSKVVDLHTTAFVTRVQVAIGVGRVGDPGGALDKVVRSDTLDICTNPGGCTCPPGSSPLSDTPPAQAGQDLRVAATGEQKATTIVQLRGISKDEWCTPKPSSAPQGKPCKESCGGSNGDPHLRTVDGFRYDLQSAGEYVLLRAPDGSVEIQGRQERPSDGADVTIGTAVAVKVNGHRVGFYAMAGGPPEIHLDGAVIAAANAGSADLGSGAKLSTYQRGYELDLPDGTKAWALSIGKWGINLLVSPSTSLRSTGVGLIGRAAAASGFKIPSPPDGSTFTKPANAHERYHDLYAVLAPGWRVTAATSIFDYAAGKTTDSYTLAAFPLETAPQSIDDLDPAAVLSAKATCATVSDPDLLDQCAYDVAVTGSTEYVTLYDTTETFEAEGTTSLGQPTSGATPPPPVIDTPTGIIKVADHLGGIGAAILGPDGTLYVYVAEQGAGFGDVKPALLAVDSATGRVKVKVPAAAVGTLSWAAGSLWAGEFNRSDAVFCEVSRLDPVTLAVQAQVPSVCSPRGGTYFGTVGDAIWFADGKGVDANGAGGHLRRIDPTTNKIDTAPSGNIDLPVMPQAVGVPGVNSFLATTSAGIVVGERQHGFYALTAGSDSFEQIDVPANAAGKLFPAGAGIWAQTEVGTFSAPEGRVVYATIPGGPGVDLAIDGDLVGGDDSAIYASPPKADQDPDALWRYPIAGGAATQLAVAGNVPSSTNGTLTLLYRDPTHPLVLSDRLLVKLWQGDAGSIDTGLTLFMQAIPLP